MITFLNKPGLTFYKRNLNEYKYFDQTRTIPFTINHLFARS